MTGSPPFRGNAAALAESHARAPVPPLPAHLGVPEAVEHVLRRLLAKDPDQRYRSAEALLAALDDALSPNADRRPLVDRPHSRWPLAMAAVAALLLAVWMIWGPQAPPPSAGALDLVVEISDPLGVSGRTGRLGVATFAAREGDEATLRAILPARSSAYLIAFRPDGHMELCWPADEATRPGREASPSYPPPGDQTPVFGLDDGAGLQAFAIVTSRAGLPPFRDWRAKMRPTPWRAVKAVDPGVIWRHDGQLLKAVRAGEPPDSRGAGTRSRGARGAIAELAEWLKDGPGVEALQVIGFAVEPRPPGMKTD